MLHNNETLLLVKFLTEHHLLDAMIVASAGGIVNYFIHGELIKENKGELVFFLKHIFISMFTGFVVGLLCIDFNITTSQTLLFAAISGTSGSEVVIVLQQKISEWLKSKSV